MLEGTILDRLTTGQRIARKVVRSQISADLAVAPNLQVVWQVYAFAYERDASVEPAGFQLVRRHVIAVANLAVLANNDLFIQDRTVNHAACTDDGVEQQDGVSDNGSLLHDDSWREHAALDMALDDTTMGDQATGDLSSAANMGGRPLLAPCVNDPRSIIEVEGRVVSKQLHVRFPVRLNSAHVLPVAGKRIGIDAFASRKHGRDNIAPEVML